MRQWVHAAHLWTAAALCLFLPLSALKDPAPCCSTVGNNSVVAAVVFHWASVWLDCSNCTANGSVLPLCEWRADDAPLLGPLPITTSITPTYSDCVLRLPMKPSSVPIELNMSELQLDMRFLPDNASGLGVAIVGPSQTATSRQVVSVTGRFNTSFFQSIFFFNVELSPPLTSWSAVLSLPLVVVYLSKSIAQMRVPGFDLLLLLAEISPTVQFLFADDIDFGGATLSRWNESAATSTSALKGLSLCRCNLTGALDTLLEWSTTPALPQLTAFAGDGNRWSFIEGFNVSRLRPSIAFVSLSRCNIQGAISLRASVPLGPIPYPESGTRLTLRVSENAFSMLIMEAEGGPGAIDLFAVDGLESVNVSNNDVPLVLLMQVGASTVSGRHVVDAFRTVSEVLFAGSALVLNDTQLVVSLASPPWLCPTGFCRSNNFEGCSMSLLLLNLTLLGGEWFTLNLKGNAFGSVWQPPGAESTEPVLLSDQECQRVVSCHIGSYVRCPCDGSSSTSRGSELEPTSSGDAPQPPFWQQRTTWVVGSLVVAAVVLGVITLVVFRRRCMGRSSDSLLAQDFLEEEMGDDEESTTLKPQRVQWSRDDENVILCDARECMYIFDQYFIHPVNLGDGTTAKVIKVTRKADRRTFAMKRYSFKAEDHQAEPAQTASSAAQFQWMELFKEFWLLRHMDHPNIIHVEEVFISFYDALLPNTLPHAVDGTSFTPSLGSGSILGSSSSLNASPFQHEYYPPESLTDHVTPFLQSMAKMQGGGIAQHVHQQQGMSRRYCYIVMSYVPNGTLGTFLAQRRREAAERGAAESATVLCEEEALYIGQQLFSALEYLHDPHRRRQLWNVATGAGVNNSSMTSQSDVMPSTSAFFHKPDIVTALSSQRFSSVTLHGDGQRTEGGHGFAQILSEDGPILHRDVKPDNILVEVLPGFVTGAHSKKQFSQTRVVLTDFGFADIYHRGTSLPHKGAPPAYSAPEVSKRNPTPSSDVFSAGIVLFELLTARVSPVKVARGHFATNILRSTFVDQQVKWMTSGGVRPETAALLFGRVLVADPNRRFNAAQVSAELRKLLAA